jgi:hypothetical protein
MRLSSTIVLTIVAALASSIAATPIDKVAQHCYIFCAHDRECDTCGPYGGYCVSISSFPGFITRLTCMAELSCLLCLCESCFAMALEY